MSKPLVVILLTLSVVLGMLSVGFGGEILKPLPLLQGMCLLAIITSLFVLKEK